MEAGGLLPRQPPQGPPGVAPGTISVCAGQGPNGHAGNVLGQSAIHELNAGQLGIAGQQQHQQQLHLQQQQHQQQQHQQHQQQQQQQMGQAPGMGEVLPPKRQAVVDRLRRRIESYRRRQTDCIPRFDQSFNGLCEQNIQDTIALKQRFLESKAKRQAKKTDKKQSDPIGLSNVHMVRLFHLFHSCHLPRILLLLLLLLFLLLLFLLPGFIVLNRRRCAYAAVGIRTCYKVGASLLPSRWISSPWRWKHARVTLLAFRGEQMCPIYIQYYVWKESRDFHSKFHRVLQLNFQ